MASDTTIKGINIKFGADSQDFDKGLKKVNKELKLSERYGNNLKKSLNFENAEDGVKQLTRYADSLEVSLKGNETKAEELRKEIDKLKDSGDDMDNARFIELNDQLNIANNKTADFRKELTKVNKDIQKLDSGKFEELSYETKKAFQQVDNLDDSVNELDDSADGLSFEGAKEEASGLASSMGEVLGVTGELGLAASTLPKLVNPATGAIALAGAGVLTYTQRVKDLRKIQFGLSSEFARPIGNINGQSKALKKLADRTGVEYGEAVEEFKKANHIFNNELKTTQDATSQTLSVGLWDQYAEFDSGEVFRIGTSASRNFNTTLKENDKLMGGLNSRMQYFGQQAEDYPDTIVEWGDTFHSTKQDIDGTLKVLDTGLLLGARNADEVANAWNEFMLRLGDGTAEGAINSIGLSYKDVVKDFDKGGETGRKAVWDVVKGLSNIEDSTKRTKIAGEIFGTYGEEFVGTVTGNKKALKELDTEFQRSKKVQDELNKTAGDNKTWDQMQTSLQLTNSELIDLKQAYKDNGLAAFDTKQKNEFLSIAVENLGKKSKLTDKQISNMKLAVKAMGGELPVTKDNAAELESGIKHLGEEGVISKSAMDDLTFATKLLSGTAKISKQDLTNMNNSITQLHDRGDIGIETMKNMNQVLSDINNPDINPKQTIDDIALAATQLSTAGQITTQQMADVKGALRDIGNDDADTETKLTAYKTIVNDLGPSFGLTKKQIDDFNGSLDGATTGAENGTTAQDGLGDSLNDVESSALTAKDAMADLLYAYLLTLNPSKRMGILNGLNADTLSRVQGNAHEAGFEINDTTGKLETYNGTDMDDKDTTVSEAGADETQKKLDKINQTTLWDKTLRVFTKLFSDPYGNNNATASGKDDRGLRATTNNNTIAPNIYITNPINTSNDDDIRKVAEQVSRHIVKGIK